MNVTLNTLLPLFFLMGVGFLARRRNILEASSAAVLNRFVVYIALPAALFDIVLRSSWTALWQPAFIATFGLATLAVFAAVLLIRIRSGKHVADASVDAIAASYSNTAYVGLPLCLLVFGDGGVIAATLATLIVVCFLFAIAVVLVEVGLKSGRPSIGNLIGSFMRSLKNPIVLAPLLGALASTLHLQLPSGATTFLKLIGQAATPCALVGLGAFLADRSTTRKTERFTPVALTAVKLLALPLLTWALGRAVFNLPPALTNSAVLMAALPTGTGPFMLAEHYHREASSTASTTLLSTLLSLVTLTVLLAIIA